MSVPVKLSTDNFASEVLRAKVPVLVDFYGERCAPCRLLRPILLELAGEYAGKLKICMLNTDREPCESDKDYENKFRTILSYGVMNLPTMLLFTGGKLRRSLIGLHTKQELLEILREEGLGLTPAKPDEDHPCDGKQGGDD